MVAAKLSVDTQLLGGPLHKQSMHQYPSHTGLGASSSRWGIVNGPDHQLTPLVPLGLRLLRWLSLHCMNRHSVIRPVSLRRSLLVLASNHVPLSGLCLDRLPLRPPHMMDMVGILTL